MIHETPADKLKDIIVITRCSAITEGPSKTECQLKFEILSMAAQMYEISHMKKLTKDE